MRERTADVIRLLRMAQGGAAEAALHTAGATLLGDAGSQAAGDGSDVSWHASLHYVRGVALHCTGDHEAALEAGRSVLQTAESGGDEAWASVGRAFQVLQATLRAESNPDSGDGDVLLQELARAEVDIPEAWSDPFALVTAHTAVGACYLHLRLYELAEPHLQAAVDISAAHPELLRVTAVTTRLNLAELHLGWGLELRRIGHPKAAIGHSRAARRYADEVAELTVFDDTINYHARAALLSACAEGDTGDPAAVIGAIRAGLDQVTVGGQRGEAAMAWLFLARALFRAGDSSAALDAARRACAELPRGALGTLTAAAYHTRADLLVNTGPHEVAEILAYGDHLAQALSSHRLRALHLARSMQVFERVRRERDSIQELAYTDALTGVGNRRAFDTWVARRTARHEDSVCVLVVDVDNLKAVNDVGGHAAGDLILRSIATVLRAQSGRDDLVARVGGDEFVVCADMPAEAGDVLAQRVVDSVTAAIGDTSSVSVGVACGPASQAGSAVLHGADQAMYEAKRDGGGQVRRSSSYWDDSSYEDDLQSG
ncbi:MAG: GGDEF domain-containing protein [Geodermatophilaceae bacterium]|nr:GGDEF domain-containing protein [Geodermatophilaceae bacterium]